MPVSVLFCGSFLEYSVSTLKELVSNSMINLVGVVTTPPRLAGAGSKQHLRKTHVHTWAETHSLPVFAPEKLDQTSLDEIRHLVGQPDILLTAGYGKLVPQLWLDFPKVAALNAHFSLLPAYRGANPAEWALLYGETTTGVSLIKMDQKFDTGPVLAQATTAIEPDDTRLSVYQNLYQLAGEQLPLWLENLAKNELQPQPQPAASPTPYAKRLNRADGFVDWETINNCLAGTATEFHGSGILESIYQELDQKQISPASYLERCVRALSEFPGVWTQQPGDANAPRIKILAVSVSGTKLEIQKAQVAGKNRPFNQQDLLTYIS